MDIQIETVQGVKVIKLEGDLDGATASLVHQRVQPLAKAGQPILLDISGVKYTSSAGIRLLLVTYRYSSNSGGKLILVGLTPGIQDVLASTGFLNFFTVCQTVEDGLKQLSQDNAPPADPSPNPE